MVMLREIDMTPYDNDKQDSGFFKIIAFLIRMIL